MARQTLSLLLLTMLPVLYYNLHPSLLRLRVLKRNEVALKLI